MRFDGFIVWGHGLGHLAEIAEMIRANSQFRILVIKRKKIDNMDNFIRQVYRLDSAPQHHLAAKTRYLKTAPLEAFYLLVKVDNPTLKTYGTGRYQTTSCKEVVGLKWAVRAKFNPKLSDPKQQPHANLPPGVSHQHVIHATDSSQETESLNKLFGLGQSSGYLMHTVTVGDRVYNYPFHLNIRNARVVTVPVADLQVNISGRYVAISETPHYRFVTGDREAYHSYITPKLGNTHIEDHLPEAFDRLLARFDPDKYGETSGTNDSNQPGDLIIVKGRRVQDGAHRLAILHKAGIKQVRVLSY